jgi:hypothetical protein
VLQKSEPKGRKSDSGSGMSDTDSKKGHSRRHADAYRKGYLAGRRGCTGADNPYENDSREARAWIMGLLDGRQRQLMVVRCPDDKC